MNHTFTDQTGRKVQIMCPPKRIVSVVPSQTELLHHLGLNNEVTGITKFCVHPAEWFRNKQRVGGTKNLDIKKIRQLNPDLIIANKEENEKDQILELADMFPVWISDVKTLPDAYGMIKSIGEITSMQPAANNLVYEIKKAFERLHKLDKPVSVIYLIWNNPFMSAGKGTFIDALLEACNFTNASTQVPGRYPQLSHDQIKTLNPDLIFLSSEPYPFTAKHVSALESSFPGCRVLTVDGELFSWYGSRLLKAPLYFHELIRYIESQIHN